jgi:hypothetical protein
LSNFKPTIVFHCEFGIPSKGPSSHKLTILYNSQVKSKLLKKKCFERYSIRLSEVLEAMVCTTNVERQIKNLNPK